MEKWRRTLLSEGSMNYAMQITVTASTWMFGLPLVGVGLHYLKTERRILCLKIAE